MKEEMRKNEEAGWRMQSRANPRRGMRRVDIIGAYLDADEDTEEGKYNIFIKYRRNLTIEIYNAGA